MPDRNPPSQRRAIAGDRHFILADPACPDLWALPGPVVATDAAGLRRFGPARTASTARLRDWAQRQGLAFRIDDRYPLPHLRADPAPA